MIDLIFKELEIHNVKLLGRGRCHYNGKETTLKDCVKHLKSNIKKNKTLAVRLWTDLANELKNQDEGMPSETMARLFVPAIKSLYGMSLQFGFLRRKGVINCLKETLDRDVNSFSSNMMSKVVEHHLAIGWIHHLIRKDMYTLALIHKAKEIAKNNLTTARGVASPWARLDLPMLERVFEWEDVAEETAGRERDKRDQRRYRMGLDDYGEGDTTPNEGFYWREIRNEPYDFDDQDETLYPHRNTLWV